MQAAPQHKFRRLMICGKFIMGVPGLLQELFRDTYGEAAELLNDEYVVY